MNLLAFAPQLLLDELPYEEFDCVYLLDDGDLDCSGMSERTSIIVVTDQPERLSEEVLAEVTDLIEVSDPVEYITSRGIPGDLAIIEWDESDETYEVLESLCTAGVVVLDGADSMTQISIDVEFSFDSLVDTITRRVTADVLRQLRAELSLDTPRRTSRFRSR